MKCKFMCFQYKYFIFSVITFQIRCQKAEYGSVHSLGLCHDTLKIPSYSNEIVTLIFFTFNVCEVYSVSSSICLLLNYINIFLLRISLQFSSSWRVQRINNPQLPSPYLQPSSWVNVSSFALLFLLHFNPLNTELNPICQLYK